MAIIVDKEISGKDLKKHLESTPIAPSILAKIDVNDIVIEDNMNYLISYSEELRETYEIRLI